MAIALISDLHANRRAFIKVIEDIRSQGIKTIYCLGDLVGYGADPTIIVEQCMEFPVTLMGDHDEAVLNEAYGFNWRRVEFDSTGPRLTG